jgi:hypothetical protein
MSKQHPNTDIPGTARPSPDKIEFIDLSELTRYDLLLAAIGFAILSAAIVGHVTAIPVWATLSAGGLVALPMVVDALAVNPPA